MADADNNLMRYTWVALVSLYDKGYEWPSLDYIVFPTLLWKYYCWRCLVREKWRGGVLYHVSKRKEEKTRKREETKRKRKKERNETRFGWAQPSAAPTFEWSKTKLSNAYKNRITNPCDLCEFNFRVVELSVHFSRITVAAAGNCRYIPSWRRWRSIVFFSTVKTDPLYLVVTAIIALRNRFCPNVFSSDLP